jgi:RND family efflux transporter MFP subunit
MSRAASMLSACLLAMAWVPGCDKSDATKAEDSATSAPSLPPVKVRTLERQQLRADVSVAATLTPHLRAAITPQVGGTLTQVLKAKGDRVEKGETLVRIAATDVRLQLDQARTGASSAEAGLAQAEANLLNAEQQYERYKKLKAGDAVTDAEFERVESTYMAAKAASDAARSQISSAQTGIRSAKKLVSDTSLQAPFSGFVVARHFDPGAAVSPMARPVLEIVNIDTVYAEGAFSELDVSKIREGAEAKVRIDAFGDEVFSGTISSISHEIDRLTRTVSVRVELANPDHRLKAGMSGSIDIDTGTRESVAVPRIALVGRRGREARVFVLQGDTVQERDVTVDPRFTEYLPVESGLEAGEVVVVWGQSRLRDGDRVRVDQTPDVARPAPDQGENPTPDPAESPPAREAVSSRSEP